MNKKCNKCGSEKLFVEIQGNGQRRGLYCGNCGKWQKWITKQELQICKLEGINTVNNGNLRVRKKLLEEQECEYCKTRGKEEVCGKEFKLLPTSGFENDRRYSSWLLKNKMDRKVGVMITTNNSNGVFFNINYCPMCGRKLGD